MQRTVLGFLAHSLADALPAFWGDSIVAQEGPAPVGMMAFMTCLTYLVPVVGILLMVNTYLPFVTSDKSGVESAKASATRKTLIIKGPAAEADVRTAVEKAGYTFKGKKQ